MPSEISSDTKSMIIALRPEGYSMPKIETTRKKRIVDDCSSSIAAPTVRAAGVIRKKRKLPPHQLPDARCKRNVSKIKKWISNPNPPTQKEISTRLKDNHD